MTRRAPGGAMVRALRAGLAGLLLLATAASGAQDLAARDEAQIKAAYVLNFLRFTDWPAEQGSHDDEGAYVLKVLGSRALVLALREIAHEGEKLGQRPVRVQRLTAAALDEPDFDAELQSAHAVFVQFNNSERTRLVLERLASKPVLTISDAPGFTKDGGMLELVPQGSRIVFDANPGAIQASGLQVSAKVLKLARAVEPPR